MLLAPSSVHIEWMCRHEAMKSVAVCPCCPTDQGYHSPLNSCMSRTMRGPPYSAAAPHHDRMYSSKSPATIRASPYSGWFGSSNLPGGFTHGSHEIIGTAPSAATALIQSARKRFSPEPHCWNQWTMAGRAPALLACHGAEPDA